MHDFYLWLMSDSILGQNTFRNLFVIPWPIGFIVAMLLIVIVQPRVHLPKPLVIACVTIAISSMMFLLFVGAVVGYYA